MFTLDGRCYFGQCGAAQSHLANRGVGIGDVFIFFGLFREEDTGEPHHRIFGYLEIDDVARMEKCDEAQMRRFLALSHPHALEPAGSNDTIYSGEGAMAQRATAPLRLTVEGGPPSLWRRPAWLKPGGLSYHDRPDRWLPGRLLKSVGRGQEFIADIGRRKAPRDWLAGVIEEIRAI